MIADQPQGPTGATDARIARRRARGVARAAEQSSYHQARVLLLVAIFAGDSGKMRGLTKLAKLDFLLRYPAFLAVLFERTDRAELLTNEVRPNEFESLAVESRMVRYKYGPWDDRYYGIVGALVGRGLLVFEDDRAGVMVLRVTRGGLAVANSLMSDPLWQVTVARCEALKSAYARAAGNKIKNEIYEHLPEVVGRPFRTVI